MIITISTSSKKLFNILERHIFSQEKGKRYTSANDFIESLFDISRILDDGNTILHPHSDWYCTPGTERHVRLISKSDRYHGDYPLPDSLFIYS